MSGTRTARVGKTVLVHVYTPGRPQNRPSPPVHRARLFIVVVRGQVKVAAQSLRGSAGGAGDALRIALVRTAPSRQYVEKYAATNINLALYAARPLAIHTPHQYQHHRATRAYTLPWFLACAHSGGGLCVGGACRQGYDFYISMVEQHELMPDHPHHMSKAVTMMRLLDMGDAPPRSAAAASTYPARSGAAVSWW